jgi:hypothetical protein
MEHSRLPQQNSHSTTLWSVAELAVVGQMADSLTGYPAVAAAADVLFKAAT